MNRAERIAFLQNELKDIQELEKKEREEKRRSVAPRMRYTLTIDEKDAKWNSLRDNCGVLSFALLGFIQNKEELESVGARTEDDGRGMNYLFNVTDKNNPLLVMPYGGGRVWFGGFQETPAEKITAEEIIKRLEAFLKANPNGGDVTHIIPQPKPSRW